MLADIQIPRALLTPFHPVFTKWLNSLPWLEHTPFGHRTGGRGKAMKLHARKAQKAGGGGVGGSVFFIRFYQRSVCLGLGGFPGVAGSLRDHWGVFFILGVAEWRILRPQVVSFTAFGSFLRLLYII